MSLYNIFRAELMHFKAGRWVLQPLITVAVMLWLFHWRSLFQLPVYGKPQAIIAEDIQSMMGASQSMVRIALAFSLSVFIYRAAGHKILHRARLDGLSKEEWIASINVQAILASALYTLICICVFTVNLLVSKTGFKMLASDHASGFWVAIYLKTAITYYLAALMGLTGSLFLKARLAPLLLLGLLVTELLVIYALELKDSIWKYMFFITHFTYRSSEHLWHYAMSFAIIFTTLQLALWFKADKLNRNTTV
ncbi:MAG: hypothetical protein V4543_15935 [Bacteroidota bacterium]